METVEFNVYEDFEQALADRFAAFMAGLKTPCTVLIDIESCGGYTEVIKEMEILITQKKAEGYVFFTNVEDYAYSCGMLLFLLGDVKTCSDSANFLYHSSGIFLMDRLTATGAREILEMLEEDDLFTERVLAENTTVAPEMLEILKKNDNFLSKEDLIYLGFMEREYELI
jgi:ATP-dependent protease ClpP protease subunit